MKGKGVLPPRGTLHLLPDKSKYECVVYCVASKAEGHAICCCLALLLLLPLSVVLSAALHPFLLSLPLSLSRLPLWLASLSPSCMLFVLSCPTFGSLFVAPKLTTISFHLLSEVNSSVPRSFTPTPCSPTPCSTHSLRPPLPCPAHTLPAHFLSFCAAAAVAAVGWFDYIDWQCGRIEWG